MPSDQNYEVGIIIVHLTNEKIVRLINLLEHTALKFRNDFWDKAISLQSALNHSTWPLKKQKGKQMNKGLSRESVNRDPQSSIK